jgi:DNA-binding CsgD family transcriptional regulator
MEVSVNEAEIAIGQSRKLKQSVTVLTGAVDYFERHGHDPARCHALSVLAKAYEQTGDLEAAVKTFNTYIALSGVIFSQERQRAVVEVQARVEIEKLERERRRMEDVAKSASERAELLAQEAARQTSELTVLALQLVKKNEFLTELREKIEQRSSGRATQDLLTEIDDHVRSDRDWEVFENQLNQVHADFLRKLSSRYPTLTPMELKTAALMKLNFTSKAIASLFCISVRTVENHRLNIRRKLALDADDNLVSFLSGL